MVMGISIALDLLLKLLAELDQSLYMLAAASVRLAHVTDTHSDSEVHGLASRC